MTDSPNSWNAHVARIERLAPQRLIDNRRIARIYLIATLHAEAIANR